MKLKNIKVGLRVQIKDTCADPELAGKEGVIIEHDMDDSFLPARVEVAGTKSWLPANFLRKVKDEPPTETAEAAPSEEVTPAPKFKVGDKVRVLTRPHRHMFPIGTEGVVANVDSDGHYRVDALDDFWFYKEEELELVQEEELELVQEEAPAPTTAQSRAGQLFVVIRDIDARHYRGFPVGTVVRCKGVKHPASEVLRYTSRDLEQWVHEDDLRPATTDDIWAALTGK